MTDQTRTIKLEFSAEAAEAHGSCTATVPDGNGGKKDIEYTNMAEVSSDGYGWKDRITKWTGPEDEITGVRQLRIGSIKSREMC